MTKGKVFATFAAGALLCSCIAPLFAAPVYRASAAENKLDNVSDDFEEYSVTGDFIETEQQFKENWTNNVLKGGEEQGMDSHLKGVAKVEYESGNSGNKVLHLNNAAVAQDSFFHIGPAGDYRTKNFTVGFRFKYLVEDVKERSWIGVSFRKKAEAHYTGTNNLMFTVQRYKNSANLGGSAYAIFNGGNTNDLGTPGTQDLFKDVLSTEYTVYTVPDAEADIDTPWMDYKLEVEGNRYILSVDDTVMIDCTFEVPTFDYFGFLSLNCCTANVLVDDFYVTNNDTELPPPINPLSAPVLSWDGETRTVSWERVDGANLYSVFLNDKLVKTMSKNSYTVEGDLEEGDYTLQVKALSDDTFEALDSALSDAVTFTVGGKSGSGGCSGAAGGLVLAPLAAAAVLLKKRRK